MLVTVVLVLHLVGLKKVWSLTKHIIKFVKF